MYGEPALPEGFDHLPYANPDAPQGGRIVMGELGGFDSLNPFILKGNAPWGLRSHVFESLMGRSIDEPFTLYGLLAATIETDDARSWVEFTLRPEARFSDGNPVTVADVMFSMQVLAEKGLPGFASSWAKVAKMEQTGPRSIRFTFSEEDRELPLILGLRPILEKADWEGHDFAESSMRSPVGSGPYVIADAKPGRSITFRRNRDYWGDGLGFNRGRNNLDEIRYDFFRDSNALFEAFRGGLTSVQREGDASRWQNAYDFPAVRDGRVVLSTIPNGRPTGMHGFVFNTRRAVFSDIRVREALTLAFNFDWINARLLDGAFRRIPSYFANSPLGIDGPAGPGERALLGSFAEELPADIFAPEEPENGDAGGRNRGALRKARKLLEEAGWHIGSGGVMETADGTPLSFEIMLRAADDEAVASIYVDALKSLGIDARARLVDDSQYNARRTTYDYDMMVNTWALSLSPGNEQEFYWGSAGRDMEGTRNYMGVASKAVDALIPDMLAARSMEDFTSAVRALDRVLTKGRYVIPFWYTPESWIAHEATLHYPQTTPLYGDWPGFLPEVWWREE
ncbi:ABC transporter substrate-binding protein [Paroceanicella profunda]|uniref:ABC transporter substrate-binding protein n=1 Tax=Paroceanicella profunda TaxID=2579971 RepID=A0A5B8FVT8_9RHOB|nr:extracellular solute-binding protein [Paroceanicella profunda]QDL92936.1 ABC transporter substrate-binding protein [Paroceanicella profunda]